MNPLGSYKGTISLVSPGTLAKGTIVTVAGAVASATVPGAGVVMNDVVAGDTLVIALFGSETSRTTLAGAAVTAGDRIVQTAAGKGITDPATGTVLSIGYALTSAALDETFELQSNPPAACKYS